MVGSIYVRGKLFIMLQRIRETLSHRCLSIIKPLIDNVSSRAERMNVGLGALGGDLDQINHHRGEHWHSNTEKYIYI